MLRRLGRVGSAFGLDASPLALALARESTAVPLARASVSELPYRDGSFDLIVCLDVLYHRNVRSDLEALRELRRILRPGGLLLLNLPAFESLRSSHDRAIHTARRYRRAPLRRLLVEAGFRPLRASYWNTLLFPGLALVRLGRRRRTGEAGSDVTPVPGALNWILGKVLDLERIWLRRRDLPFGLSLMAAAVREP